MQETSKDPSVNTPKSQFPIILFYIVLYTLSCEVYAFFIKKKVAMVYYNFWILIA